jgi:hypothetical protein
MGFDLVNKVRVDFCDVLSIDVLFDIRSSVMMASIPCLNHQTFLSHLDMVLAVFNAMFLSKMHSTARFFNMGAHRLRCTMSVPSFLRSGVVRFVEGYPDQHDTAFSLEVLSYIEAWQVRALDAENPRKSVFKRTELLRLFFALVGGGFASSTLVVFAKGAAMTRSWKDRVIRELEPLVQDLLFLSLFPQPSTGKWTKTGPCSERFLLGYLNGMMQSVMGMALGHLTFSAKECETDLDDGFVEWNRIGSKISKVALSFVCSELDRALMMVLLVVDEVLMGLPRPFTNSCICQWGDVVCVRHLVSSLMFVVCFVSACSVCACARVCVCVCVRWLILVCASWWQKCVVAPVCRCARACAHVHTYVELQASPTKQHRRINFHTGVTRAFMN